MLVLFLLVLVTATTHAQQTYKFSWNSDWFNPQNWNSPKLPTTGDVVAFSPSLSSFGHAACKSTDMECSFGGTVLIKAPNDDPVLNLTIGQLYPPENGKIRLGEGVRLIFSDVVRYFNGSVSDPSSPNYAYSSVNNVVWKSQSPSDFDFRCASNWVINGTNSNPNFTVPCFMDTALFSSGDTIMTVVPANTFVSQLISTDNNFVTDPYQYSGWPLNFINLNCLQPFSTNRGYSYCSSICFNTCPELHPDYLAGLQLQISQNSTLVGFLQTAIEQANAAQNQMNSQVSINGPVSFSVPSGTPTSSIAFVTTNILNLTNNYPYKLSISCSSSQVSISCNFQLSCTQAQLKAYSSSQPPYTFNTGLLSTIFQPYVTAWFNFAAMNVSATSAAIIANTTTSVSFSSIQVPARFINELGTPFPIAVFSQAIESSLSLSNVVIDVQVLAGSVPNTNTLIVYTSSDSVSAAVSSLFTDVNNVFTVTLSNGNVATLYEANDVTPGTQPIGAVMVTLTNSALYSALPLSSSGQATLMASVQTVLGSHIPLLGVIAVRQDGTARRATSSPIVLTLYVPSVTDVTNSFTGSSFSSLSLNGVFSSGGSLVSISVSEAEIARLQHQASVQQQQLNMASNTIANQLADLLATATNDQSVGIGSYQWSDINIINQASLAPGLTLTNQQCKDFQAYLNLSTSGQTNFKSDLSSAMSKLLPVPAGAINFQFDITCGPVDSYQLLADQPAVFNIAGMNITALYTLFARGASYVTFPAPQAIVTNQQTTTETTSLLSQASVRSALETSMRTVVLTGLSAYYGLHVQSLMTTYSAATAQSAGSSILIVAAAAGAAVVIIVVLIIVVVLRRRNSRAAPSDVRAVVGFENSTYDRRKSNARDVVAFENPMYDRSKQVPFENTPNPNEGLYDEPAFMNKQDKANPLFNSDENLASGYNEFDTVINNLQSGFAMELTNDDYNLPASPDAFGYLDSAAAGDDTGYLDVAPVPYQNEDQPIYDSEPIQAIYDSEPTFESQQPIYDNSEPFEMQASEQPIYDNNDADIIPIETNQPVDTIGFAFDGDVIYDNTEDPMDPVQSNDQPSDNFGFSTNQEVIYDNNEPTGNPYGHSAFEVQDQPLYEITDDE